MEKQSCRQALRFVCSCRMQYKGFCYRTLYRAHRIEQLHFITRNQACLNRGCKIISSSFAIILCNASVHRCRRNVKQSDVGGRVVFSFLRLFSPIPGTTYYHLLLVYHCCSSSQNAWPHQTAQDIVTTAVLHTAPSTRGSSAERPEYLVVVSSGTSSESCLHSYSTKSDYLYFRRY